MKNKHLLPAVVLAQFAVGDQFGNAVEWKVFEKVPAVLVMAGKPAALDAKAWGVYLQQTFNGGFQPSPDHLQTLRPSEKVKVVAVASLPEVPQFLRFLFRSGFRDESKSMGIVLDFSSLVSKTFGYDAEKLEPSLAIVPPAGDERMPVVLTGPSSSEDMKVKVAKAISAMLPAANP
jgi:hypothetical protein